MTLSLHTSDRKAVSHLLADPFKRELLRKSIALAFEEDLGSSGRADLTTAAIADANLKVKAAIYCKQADVRIAGLELVLEVFRYLETTAEFRPLVIDGAYLDSAPKPIANLSAKASTVLGAERIALNLLQRMSGIATLTSRFVELANPHGIAILDTRKTTPGLRVFERCAVALGGGINHRFALNDGILVKDNHIQIAGSVKAAIGAVRKAHPQRKIEVECTSLKQVEECLEGGAEKIMLDNMTPQMVQEAINMVKGSAYLEVSGGINLSNIKDYLLAGIDAISIGALTHSAESVDLSLEVEGYL
jgi:nicotinate-nucleotide pyrophosphorylase (carboxylating)